MTRESAIATAAVLCSLLGLAVLSACQATEETGRQDATLGLGDQRPEFGLEGPIVDGQAATPVAGAGEAIQLALTGNLPYGVDITGGDTAISSLSQPTSLSDLLAGKNFTVLNAFPALAQAPGPCQGDDCRQVELYNYTDDTTIVATVDLAGESVLDVHVLPDTAPALNAAMAARLEEVARDDPRVVAALDGRGYVVTMGPVGSRQDSGPCATEWCVLLDLAPDTELARPDGDRLVVIVNVRAQAVVDVLWRSSMRVEAGE